MHSFIWLFGLGLIVVGARRIVRTTSRSRAERNTLKSILDASPVCLALIDSHAAVQYANPAYTELVSVPPDALIGRQPGVLLGCVHQHDNHGGCGKGAECRGCEIRRAITEALTSGTTSLGNETKLLTQRNGLEVLRYVRFSVQPVGDGSRQVVLALEDISTQKVVTIEPHASERHFHVVTDTAPVLLWTSDQPGKGIYFNKGWCSFTGRTHSELVGHGWTEVVHPDDLPGYLKKLDAAFEIRQPFTMEYRLRRYDGEYCWILDAGELRWLEDRTFGGFVVSSIDITESKRMEELLHKREQQLHHLAFYDVLTGLPNRLLFNDRFCQATAEAGRHKQNVGLMFLDLDNFKMVNDTLGHDTGDRLLCDVSARLRSCVRDYDTVARLGGDEFAIILPEIRSGEDMGTIARKILDAFTEPFPSSEKELFVSTSIGITCYPLDSSEMTELLKYADVAMYHAKAQGRSNFQFYSATLTAHVAERQALEDGLRKAVTRGELELFYQPKVKLPTGTLVGAEALLRWNHPERGLVLPETFIGIAEDTGLIVGIGKWMLRSACLTASEWNREAATPLKVAVNMSGRQFALNDIVGTVRDILEETACRPEWLEIEITERLFFNGNDDNLRILQALHEMGITLAIDDFGTGYSTLGNITRFPIDTLKIDRSFIHDIISNPDSADLVRAVISLAGSLRMGLVAEGVETLAQASYLNDFGCDLAQGYLFAKPMPRESFEEWMVDEAARKA
ncbi:MAG: EAL domain-containing protein [Desulfuromonadales bacterium]|nr:EAL domain-containing protein [Desulfuromonadales bacterium]